MQENSLFSETLRLRGVEYHKSIDSTNLRAKQLAREGAPHGWLVLAESQSAGRGRRGRTWVSPPGRGVYMSLIVRAPGLRAEGAWVLVFLSAVALARACAALSSANVQLKWPNDLVCKGKKLCGTLLEIDVDAQGRLNWAVIGTGINVLGADFPSELPYAGSLELVSAQQVDRAALVERYLDEFDALFAQWRAQGNSAVLQPYRALSATLGAQVRCHLPEGILEGTAEDIAADGALLVRDALGVLHALHAGDVSVRGANGYV